MDKKVFFNNFSSVIAFGVFGTILQFSLFAFGLYLLNKLHIFAKTGLGNLVSSYLPFELSPFEMLLMGALICSSDPVAAIAVVRQDQQPKLFSVVVGEGITNDAVGIIIFETVMHYGGSHASTNWLTGVKIVASFVSLCLISTVIGCAIGMVSSLVFKFFRGLTLSSSVECILVYCFGYISYLTAESFE